MHNKKKQKQSLKSACMVKNKIEHFSLKQKYKIKYINIQSN